MASAYLNCQKQRSFCEDCTRFKKLWGYMIKNLKSTYFESNGSLNEASIIRQILAIKINPPCYVRKCDGTLTECTKDIVNTLMDVHFPVEEEETDGQWRWSLLKT